MYQIICTFHYAWRERIMPTTRTGTAICLITWNNNVIFIYTLSLIDGDMIGPPPHDYVRDVINVMNVVNAPTR